MPGLPFSQRWLPCCPGGVALAVSAGLTVLVATAGCASTAAAPHSASPRTIAAPRDVTKSASAPGPRYFLDLVRSSGAVSGGQLQVRRSATGALVQQPDTLALSVAPLRGTQYVVAERAGDGCASALYRMSVNSAGRLGPATSLGPVVRGEVTSLASAGNGRTIAYFASSCSKSASGYFGTLRVRTGKVRRWGDVSIDGSAGDIAVGGSLSLSANGRLAAFSGAALGRGGVVTGQRVWVLRTSAPAGTLAQRSEAVLARPASGAQLDSVLLQPDGQSFYLCTVGTKGTASARRTVTQTAVVSVRRTSDGARTGTVATLTASGVTVQSETLGCPMAASPAGSYLLAPYSLRSAKVTTTGPLVSAARIDVKTKAASRISFRLPGSAGMSVATGVTIAW